MWQFHTRSTGGCTSCVKGGVALFFYYFQRSDVVNNKFQYLTEVAFLHLYPSPPVNSRADDVDTDCIITHDSSSFFVSTKPQYFISNLTSPPRLFVLFRGGRCVALSKQGRHCSHSVRSPQIQGRRESRWIVVA